MSLRLRLLNALLRAAVKPRLRAVTDPARARREFETFARFLLPGPGAAPVAKDPDTRLPVAWGTAPRSPALRTSGSAGHLLRPGQSAVLWFHGGGYIAGSCRTHRGLAGRLALASGLPVFLPEYRLGPENAVPAAQADARAAWEALRTAGYAADAIVLGGDSAGGGLAMALLAALLAEGVRPAGVVLMSPWVDLTGSGASLRENADADPMLPADRFGDLVHFAIGDHPPADPRVSPLFARFRGGPPVLIQHSQTEILRDDSLRLADRLRRDGVEVEIVAWPDTPHAWPVFGGWLPESRAAVAQAASFLARLRPPPAS